MDTAQLFGTEKISRILFRLAPPVMLAQLIQALYNIIPEYKHRKRGDGGRKRKLYIYCAEECAYKN